MLVGTTTSQYGTLHGAVVHGAVVRGAVLQGTLVNNTMQLVARAQIPASATADVYDGEYEITPCVDAQVLDTKNKLMQDDVAVLAIPYYTMRYQTNKTDIRL